MPLEGLVLDGNADLVLHPEDLRDLCQGKSSLARKEEIVLMGVGDSKAEVRNKQPSQRQGT